MALGMIPDLTRQVLEARDVAMDGQTSKKLLPQQVEWADLIVNMTGLPASSVFPEAEDKVEDWEVEDPFGQEPGVFELTCDAIEARVGDLARRLRQMHAVRKT